MTVSWRNTLIASGCAITLSAAGLAFAQTVSVPGVTVGNPTNAPTSGCCTGGQNHNVTAPGVTVPSPNIVKGSSSAQIGYQYNIEGSYTSTMTGVVTSGVDTRTTFLSNRSYIPMADPIEPSTLDLNVKGSTREKMMVTEKVPVQEKVCVNKVVAKKMVAPVQAVCLDDTGMPHPASRLSADVAVIADYNGEVFRCVAGTFMQVTVGTMVKARADFSNAQSFRCEKGEALVHAPGGALKCAPQAPQRNCNERSLLRKYGAGIKMIETVVQTKICEPKIETHYKEVKKEVEKDVPLPRLPITLDGGVGQIVTY